MPSEYDSLLEEAPQQSEYDALLAPEPRQEPSTTQKIISGIGDLTGVVQKAQEAFAKEWKFDLIDK